MAILRIHNNVGLYSMGSGDWTFFKKDYIIVTVQYYIYDLSSVKTKHFQNSLYRESRFIHPYSK